MRLMQIFYDGVQAFYDWLHTLKEATIFLIS